MSSIGTRKLWLRLVYIFLIIVTGFLVLLLVASLLFGDKAKEMIVAEINSNLLVPAEVGDISFSIFRSFPDASVSFSNIAVQPPKDRPDAPGLIHARSIRLRFGIFSLFSKNYRIRSIEISHASITLFRDINGNTNYNIWKKQEGSSSKPVNFDIQKILLTDTEIFYRDLSSPADVAISLPHMLLKGKTGNGLTELSLDGSMAPLRLTFGGESYPTLPETRIHMALRLDAQSSTLHIDKGNVMAGNIPLKLSGWLGYGSKNQLLNLDISTSKADISEFMEYIPAALTSKTGKYKPDGKLNLTSKISGGWGKGRTPAIAADFSIEKGELLHSESGLKLHDLSLSGKYTGKSGNKPDQLNISSFNGHTGRGSFKGSLSLNNTAEPRIILKISTRLFLDEVRGLLSPSDIEMTSGEMIADVSLEGGTAQGQQLAEKAQGQVVLKEAAFRLKRSGREIKNLNASLELNNGSVFFDQLTLVSGESDLKLSGKADHLIDYLFDSSQLLNIQAEVNSDNIRLEDLILPSPEQNSAETAGGSFYPENISIDAAFNCKHLTYRKFSASNISGKISLNEQVLRASQLKLEAMGGRVDAAGVLNGRYGDHAMLVCNATFKNVDIARLFAEFEDFGQSSLQSRHIAGSADATLQYSARLSRDFSTDAASVTAIADVEIRNGQLKGFEPMQELSSFLDAEELSDIRFATLSNRIEIANKTVIIPNMEVHSSVLDLKGYGAHTFGNEIDYHFNLALSDLRKSRRRSNQAPEGSSSTDSRGNTRLFLHLYGTVDEPQFRYDKEAVTRKMADDFKNQKQELRQAIRQEFGKKGKNEITQPPASGEKFEIEWD